MTKLVIIDAMAILHRAYHALPKFMKTKSGEPINAVYGFVSMLIRIIDDLEPSHIVVAFDRPEPTFRKKEFEDYQSHRPETDESLSSQFEKAKDVCDAMGITRFDKAGYEADDIIGTIARKATVPQISNFQFPISKQKTNSKNKSKNKGKYTQFSKNQTTIDEVVIVTGDKDQFQLVTDRIKLYVPISGLSKAKMYGEREVEEKMGVNPPQIVDYKGLVGDPSDNYKGVNGIGPKTAVSLIHEFGGFTGVYTNLNKIPEKTRKKLEEGRKSGEVSYKLAKIDSDVPIEVNFVKMDKWDMGGKRVDKLFEEYGFRTLRKRVKNNNDINEKQKDKRNSFKKKLSKEDVEKVAVEIAKKIHGKQYAIRGTASMVLQGLDMGVDDIDIIADKRTALEINKIFKSELINKVEYSESDKFRSYFGSFAIDGVYCEVAGEFQVNGKNGWTEKQDANDKQVKELKLKGKSIKTTKLELELKTSADMGRWNEFHKIKKQIEEKNQQSLF